MKTNKEFDNILDECLERLLVNGEPIEQCLQSYPEQAGELEPLLQTALIASKASAVQPRAEFKAKARYQFHSALQEVASRRSRPFFSWLPRWATVATMAIVLVLAGGSTVAVADNSMPDSPLYQVKLATEQVRLTLTPSQIGKAELCAELVDRRVAEIVYMANKGNARQVESITQRLDECLVMLVVLSSVQMAGGAPEMLAPVPEAMPPEGAPPVLAPAPAAMPSEEAPSQLAPPPESVPSEESRKGRDIHVEANNRAKLRTTVARYAVNHPAALRAVLEKAPESAKPALRRAIAVSVAGYKRALEALD